MQRTNHYFIITTTDGQMRGKVTYGKHLGTRRGVANHQVETREILPIGMFPANYTAPSQEAAATYQVFRVSVSETYRWVSFGMFTRNKEKQW
jgi:hypothetical protein